MFSAENTTKTEHKMQYNILLVVSDIMCKLINHKTF